MALRQYLATEVALDHAEGHLTRRPRPRTAPVTFAGTAGELQGACGTTGPDLPRRRHCGGQIEEADLVADLKSGPAELARRKPGGAARGDGVLRRRGHGVAAARLRGEQARRRRAVLRAGARHTVVRRHACGRARCVRREGQPGQRGPDKAEAALTGAGLIHELLTVPDVGHAFFNDTGPRFDAPAAAMTYERVQGWFRQHLV